MSEPRGRLTLPDLESHTKRITIYNLDHSLKARIAKIQFVYMKPSPMIYEL